MKIAVISGNTVHARCDRCNRAIVITRRNRTHIEGKNPAMVVKGHGVTAFGYCPDCNTPYEVPEVQQFFINIE